VTPHICVSSTLVGLWMLSDRAPAPGPAARCPCGSAAVNQAAACSRLERGREIALGRFMVGRCEAVCLPTVGLQVG